MKNKIKTIEIMRLIFIPILEFIAINQIHTMFLYGVILYLKGRKHTFSFSLLLYEEHHKLFRRQTHQSL